MRFKVDDTAVILIGRRRSRGCGERRFIQNAGAGLLVGRRAEVVLEFSQVVEVEVAVGVIVHDHDRHECLQVFLAKHTFALIKRTRIRMTVPHAETVGIATKQGFGATSQSSGI